MFTAYLKIGSRAFSPGKVKSFFYPLVYWVTMRTRTPMLATLFLYTRRRQYMSLHHQDIVLSISPLRIRYRASLVQINLVLLNYLIMNFIHCIGTRTKNWNNVVKMFLKQNLFYKNRPIHFFLLGNVGFLLFIVFMRQYPMQNLYGYDCCAYAWFPDLIGAIYQHFHQYLVRKSNPQCKSKFCSKQR